MVSVKEWVQVLKHNPVAFGLETGFDDLRPIHNEWIKKFLYNTEDMTLQAHRGSYKTTCLAIAMGLMIVVFPDKNIIFLRKADDDVKEIVVQVAKLLRTDFFQALAVSLYGVPIILTKESAFEIDTNLKQSARGTSQLLGIGSRASLTGKHADIVITDDIVNVNDRISKAHRERTKFTYQELQNVKNRGGRFINTGTPWHKDDAFTLMPNLEKYDVYTTGMINDEERDHLKDSMSPSLFSANYELKHIDDTQTMFHNPVIASQEETEKVFNGLMHIDASYGGADNTAITIIKEQSDGLFYVYGYLREGHISDMLEEVESKRRIYRAGTVYMESNGDKGMVLRDIDEPTQSYHESGNKHMKITTYLKKYWDKIVFVNETDPEYINQILEYTEIAQHDDAPDSLASILREMEDKVEVTTYNFRI